MRVYKTVTISKLQKKNIYIKSIQDSPRVCR